MKAHLMRRHADRFSAEMLEAINACVAGVFSSSWMRMIMAPTWTWKQHCCDLCYFPVVRALRRFRRVRTPPGVQECPNRPHYGTLPLPPGSSRCAGSSFLQFPESLALTLDRFFETRSSQYDGLPCILYDSCLAPFAFVFPLLCKLAYHPQ